MPHYVLLPIVSCPECRTSFDRWEWDALPYDKTIDKLCPCGARVAIAGASLAAYQDPSYDIAIPLAVYEQSWPNSNRRSRAFYKWPKESTRLQRLWWRLTGKRP